MCNQYGCVNLSVRMTVVVPEKDLAAVLSEAEDKRKLLLTLSGGYIDRGENALQQNKTSSLQCTTDGKTKAVFRVQRKRHNSVEDASIKTSSSPLTCS
ncbi:unnamed protein product [Clavelina lepadiformis]|uniref:Uncharacterized protein n=1 Tax=Clavelina lepadiformis TaxID=159417 RepID=A0ABP0F9F2_CLALP